MLEQAGKRRHKMAEQAGKWSHIGGEACREADLQSGIVDREAES